MPVPRPSPVAGVVLAGGETPGLAPLTSHAHPKALLDVAGNPALFYPLLSLHRAEVTHVTVLTTPAAAPAITAYAAALPAPLSALAVSVVAVPPGAGSADALRALPSSAAHALVVPADLVADCALAPLIDAHFAASASCSVLLAEACAPAADTAADAPLGNGGSKRRVGKQAKSAAGAAATYEPELYATVDGGGARLLALVDDGELEDDGVLRVRAPLLRRFPDLCVRADLRDPHVYLLAPWVVQELLPARRAIVSLRLDLVPYVARRQFALGRCARAEGWTLPAGAEGDVRVRVEVVPYGGFVTRVNTPDAFLSAVLDVAGGALAPHLDGGAAAVATAGQAGKKGGKKKGGGDKSTLVASPFAQAGERTNVSADSRVGADCTAGDRASVKKSCVSDGVVLGAGVKVNGCALLKGVRIGDATTLAACVVSVDAVVERGCVLKNCRVAPGVCVPEGTEAEGKDFTGAAEVSDLSGFMDAFEFS